MTFPLKVFIWALYFDNFPHGHYGTIRQQIWSLFHFPFQLAVVGVVEGSQQIALARYVLKSVEKGAQNLHKICEQNLDGAKLQEALLKLTDYYRFDKKLDTYAYYDDIHYHIELIGNATGICSPQNVTSYTTDSWPEDFAFIENAIQNGVYAGTGVKMPIDKLKALYEPIEIAEKSWWLTYMYFWSCFCGLILSLIVFLILIRRHKVDTFDFVSIIMRCLVLGAGGAALAILASPQRLVDLLNSPAILPMAVVLLFVVLVGDKLATLWSNRRLTSSGEPYALEYEDDHHFHAAGHGNGHGHEEHGEIRMLGETEHLNLHYGRPDLKKLHRKSAGWSIHADSVDLTAEDMAYSAHRYSQMTQGTEAGLLSPALRSPSPPRAMSGAGQGGYMPVAS